MNATAETLMVLDDLAAADLELLQTDKKLTDLPQRASILACRKKKAAFSEKLENVLELKAKTEKKLSLVSDEDERRAVKQAAVEAAIAEGGDYRNIEARTKELNGYVKRRDTLVGELSGIEADLTKIAALETQLRDAIGKVEEAERVHVTSFKEEGRELQAKLADLSAVRKDLMAQLPEQICNEYLKVAKSKGGIALARLEGKRCTTCRGIIDDSHYSQLRADAPLSHCPCCGRLIIVG